jgi:hypothetical protein
MSITLQLIDVGTVPGDGQGDPARTAFQIINSNSGVLDGAIEDAELKAFVVKIYGKDELVEVQTDAEWWRQPYAFVLLEVRAACYLEQSGDDIQIDILEDGVSVLGSNPLIIPAGSDTSYGYSPAPDTDYTILNDNAKMTIDVVDSGSSPTALGLEVTLIGYVIWVTS